MILAGALVGAQVALAQAADLSLDELANLNADSAPVAISLPTARAALLSEAAIPLGSHKGLADRSVVLIDQLEGRALKLDALYRFPALVTKTGMLPPVISEARDALVASDDQIRVADRIYKIMSPARFITIPPTWRDYLFTGLRIKAAQQIPYPSVLPKNAAESAFWKDQVMKGYAQGVALADEILRANMSRLDRDYLGMLRYSELLNKGMVTEPSVAVAPTVVSGDRNQLNVGDTLYRVTDHGGFVVDAKKWQPIVEPSMPAALPASPNASAK